MQENENLTPEHDDVHDTHDHHHEGFFRKYIFSLDHKMIGKQFLIYGLLMLFLGGGLAMLFRWQLAYPEIPSFETENGEMTEGKLAKPLPIIGASDEFLKEYLETGEAEPRTWADRMWINIIESEESEWGRREHPIRYYDTCIL